MFDITEHDVMSTAPKRRIRTVKKCQKEKRKKEKQKETVCNVATRLR
jgi:hypothetical protein